ncbi:MAG: protein phosphatase 2C domain-containing protein [Polyangiaceae bacterium]
MDTNLWMAGGAALLVALVGWFWSGREPEKKPAPAVRTNEKKAPAKNPSTERDKSRRARTERPMLPVPTPEEDVEITLIATAPIADIVRKVRAEHAAAQQANDATSPSVSAEVAGPESDSQRPSRVDVSYEAEAEAEEVTSPVVRILIHAAGDSDRGRTRAKNEDSILVFPERSLFVVADGMGGHAGGEIASSVAVDVMRDSFERSVFEARTESATDVPRRGRELACSIQMANEAIYALAQNDPALNKMGTTVVSARFSPNKQRVYIGHVGDSRCYRLRGEEFRQLTKDHTMSTFGVTGPRGNDLYQAVGVQPTLNIDLIVDKPSENDVYLLCSDGLSKMVRDEEIRELLLHQDDLEASIYGLMELANDRGGRDNITLILVKVIERPVKVLALDARS